MSAKPLATPIVLESCHLEPRIPWRRHLGRSSRGNFDNLPVYFAITTTVEQQPRGVNMVSAMVTVMTLVFFFDNDESQVQCLRPG